MEKLNIFNMQTVELAQRVEARLAELGRKPIPAAVAVGLERTYLRDLIKGRKKSVSSDRYELVAKALDWTVAELLARETAAGAVSAPAQNIREPGDVVRTPELDNPRLEAADVPVLGITVGGDDGDFWLNGEVVNRVRRPPGLRHARGVFALTVGGDSMYPRYRLGDLIYVQKAPPVPGDDIVIEMKETNEGGDRRSFLKEFCRRHGAKLMCKQFNPPKNLQFDQAKIENVFRVIPLKELMG